MADNKKAEKPQKRTVGGFFDKSTVDVTFPDGKKRRVNKFEAESLRKKFAKSKKKES